MLHLTMATSQEDFESLHRAADSVRVDVGTIRVNKQALLNLLFDHSQLVGVCEDDFKVWIDLEHGSSEATLEASRAFELYRSVDNEN